MTSQRSVGFLHSRENRLWAMCATGLIEGMMDRKPCLNQSYLEPERWDQSVTEVPGSQNSEFNGARGRRFGESG